jgi:hypothetical protein
MGQVDAKIETGGAVKHHGKDRSCRAEQLDVGSPDMRCHEQTAGASRQRKPDSLKHMRRS